ncbi:efflux RND transporter permease subunit [uncultured Desulfuromusa sp.]|uniref:efflux RND transporter permease subunit n=1 Tax=uncultured Desulfuromusa sp. TaxID=219183 RepID=UPI002AA8174C|nr:efflux RND transporter permease subunit [uncultured Desulfuromusa sp.]
MNGAVKWMAMNHVAANLLMLVLIIGGVIMAPSIKQEIFPEVSLDRVSVSVAYPGAGPEEVEEGIIIKIEESLTAVDGIKQLKATANEGIGTVLAEIYADEDVDDVLQDIKSEVDRITTFPEDAEKPVISKLSNRREVISLVIYGDAKERVLREQAERIRDELLELPNITQVDLSGVRPFEITIEIPERTLQRYNLTLDQVAAAIRAASLDLPGGTIKTTGGEILLRTKERRYWGPEYADITILANADGTQVKLSDIATVVDGFSDSETYGRFDGKPAAMLKVFRIGEQKPTEISEQIISYVEENNANFPESLNLAVWNDTTEIFNSRMSLLQKNALLGLGLVIIILGLFLEIRLAGWVMLGIPISFFGTLFLMPWIGVSINMISLFAFILALGIVVDDAIVVGENIYEHRQRGKPYRQAAIDGALEVAVPVTFSILTTVAAFLPLIYVSGMMGKFIKVIPIIVITLLLMSLLESLLVLPAHLSSGKARPVKKGILGRIDQIRNWFSSGLNRFVDGPYLWFLKLNLNYRYISLAIGIVALLITIGVVKNGLIKFTFMPEVDGDRITVGIQMNQGVPIEETAKVSDFILKKGMETVAEYDQERPPGDSILRNVYTVVGGNIAGGGPGGGSSTTATNISNIAMFLTKSELRNIPATDISTVWRKKVGEIPGLDSLTFRSSLVRMGANIDVLLAHQDFFVLEQASERIRQLLTEYQGVSDIEDTYSRGKREIKLKLKPAARTLGITETDLGRQVRAAFYGTEALRLQRGRNEIKVMVRYPDANRRELWNFESMRIRTPGGQEIPLKQAAEIIEGQGFSEINRTDRKRVINISATVNNQQSNAQEIISDLKQNLLPQLVADYPGLSWDMEGEEKERKESLGSMLTGFKLAMVAIFALLAIPFRSYSQPLLIMAAIPFGMIGAVLGHIIMGFNLSLLSMFGLVALSGVVVNDSLLLIDKANQNRRAGMSMFDAIVSAGTRRFRPIILTSLTTFFGLTPMILETSVQAQFLVPMAISLGFGILFGTGIILLLIPALYMILEDIRKILGFKEEHARQHSEMVDEQ